MRTVITVASIFATTLIALSLPQVAPQQQEATETVGGIVMRADTQTPLAETRVELVSTNYARLPTGIEKPCKPEPSKQVTDSLHDFLCSRGELCEIFF